MLTSQTHKLWSKNQHVHKTAAVKRIKMCVTTIGLPDFQSRNRGDFFTLGLHSPSPFIITQPETRLWVLPPDYTGMFGLSVGEGMARLGLFVLIRYQGK